MSAQEAIREQVDSFEGNPDPFVTQAIHNTAAAIVEQAGDVRAGENVLIWFDPTAMQLVKEMNLRCLAKGANVSYFMRDTMPTPRKYPI